MLTLLAALLFITQPAAASAAPDAHPIILTIDGVPHELHDGRTVTLTIDGKTHEVRIDLPAVTRFSGRLITFDFPSSFTGGVSHDDEDVTHSRYVGGNAILMVWEFNAPMPFDLLFDFIVGEYGDAVAEGSIAEVTLDADIARLSGRSISVNFASAHIRQEVYRIANAEATTFILLQDARDNPTEPTEHFTTLRETLAKTLKTK